MPYSILGQPSRLRSGASLADVITEEFLWQPMQVWRERLAAVTGDKRFRNMPGPDVERFIENTINELGREERARAAGNRLERPRALTEQQRLWQIANSIADRDDEPLFNRFLRSMKEGTTFSQRWDDLAGDQADERAGLYRKHTASDAMESEPVSHGMGALEASLDRGNRVPSPDYDPRGEADRGWKMTTVDREGAIHYVPYTQLPEAMSVGHTIVMPMTSAKGRHGYVPVHAMDVAQQRGFTLGHKVADSKKPDPSDHLMPMYFGEKMDPGSKEMIADVRYVPVTQWQYYKAHGADDAVFVTNPSGDAHKWVRRRDISKANRDGTLEVNGVSGYSIGPANQGREDTAGGNNLGWAQSLYRALGGSVTPEDIAEDQASINRIQQMAAGDAPNATDADKRAAQETLNYEIAKNQSHYVDPLGVIPKTQSFAKAGKNLKEAARIERQEGGTLRGQLAAQANIIGSLGRTVAGVFNPIGGGGLETAADQLTQGNVPGALGTASPFFIPIAADTGATVFDRAFPTSFGSEGLTTIFDGGPIPGPRVMPSEVASHPGAAEQGVVGAGEGEVPFYPVQGVADIKAGQEGPHTSQTEQSELSTGVQNEQSLHSDQTPNVIQPKSTRGSKGSVTRLGIKRDNPGDWLKLMNGWDDVGYGEILSDSNRTHITNRKTPIVDDAWVKYFPEDEGLSGEQISMHHVQGLPLTVPLPYTRHLAAHMPGGFRYNPGGFGSAWPFYLNPTE